MVSARLSHAISVMLNVGDEFGDLELEIDSASETATARLPVPSPFEALLTADEDGWHYRFAVEPGQAQQISAVGPLDDSRAVLSNTARCLLHTVEQLGNASEEDHIGFVVAVLMFAQTVGEIAVAAAAADMAGRQMLARGDVAQAIDVLKHIAAPAYRELDETERATKVESIVGLMEDRLDSGAAKNHASVMHEQATAALLSEQVRELHPPNWPVNLEYFEDPDKGPLFRVAVRDLRYVGNLTPGRYGWMLRTVDPHVGERMRIVAAPHDDARAVVGKTSSALVSLATEAFDRDDLDSAEIWGWSAFVIAGDIDTQKEMTRAAVLVSRIWEIRGKPGWKGELNGL